MITSTKRKAIIRIARKSNFSYQFKRDDDIEIALKEEHNLDCNLIDLDDERANQLMKILSSRSNWVKAGGYGRARGFK